VNESDEMEKRMKADKFNAAAQLDTGMGKVRIYRLAALEDAGIANIDRLPYSIRVLLESVLRQVDGYVIKSEDVINLAGWRPDETNQTNVPFKPMRVVMQDFTGVPAIVDLAAMRSALAKAGGNPERINPHIPVDLVIDHSVQVDYFASAAALERNAELEFQRNRERYEFLRWSQEAFDNLRVVPPATGIVHQVNLEYLAKVVMTAKQDGHTLAFPDTLVGTDSHTTMINALGVLGWGVGGIEAEAAILGQPLVIPTPDVVGFRLVGQIREGTTATDVVLTVTQMLRQFGVVGKFVEFHGPGLSNLSIPDRATISNMSPEYGATAGFFPVDDETLRYLRLTGRSEKRIDLVERYCKEQALFHTQDSPVPSFSAELELDLGTVETSLAGPKRPQDRIPLSEMKSRFHEILSTPTRKGGYGLQETDLQRKASLQSNGSSETVGHGALVIAAITSCTNTSNPSVMIGAGLLARNAVERGLQVKPYVKTSLAPGSRVVTEYLSKANLLDPLSKLGFNVVGYGCTTCIGNSGPLPAEVAKAVTENDLIAAAILSGNRNFEGRINPFVQANYLASPPLVVAYALAGKIDIDFNTEPIGNDDSGEAVFLRDIWPLQSQIVETIEKTVNSKIFRERYADVFSGNATWNAIPETGGSLYEWDPDSTYIQEPPFFIDLGPDIPAVTEIHAARVLALLGDSITTDHISPAGAIPASEPAGQYLQDHDVKPADFNSFGSRRGNDRVMTRGTFGNIRLKNLLVPGVEGGFTLHFPDGEQTSIYEAAMKYKDEEVPLIVIAGKEYGTGSSRDWAAKGTLLLGVKAVIAESYERIHRSNLVGMGVLPLQFNPGENAQKLGLTGHEVYDIEGLDDDVRPGSVLQVHATGDDDARTSFDVRVRIDTPIEIDYYRNGGILHSVLRKMIVDSET
jgi:aconitate hydratase